jgi:rhamnosyltransferase
MTPPPTDRTVIPCSEMRSLDPTSIGAVVVSYFPDPELVARVAALVPQVGSVVVVDNGSRGEAHHVLRAVRALPGVEVVENPENRGIAAALNQGAAAARARGHAWLATFDQDSTVPAGFFEALARAHHAHPRRERVALVAPVYHDEPTGTRHSFGRPGSGAAAYREIELTLTSGSVLRLDVLEALGGFDAGYFIDYVDIEYCLRCRAAGYVLLEAPEAELLHNLGASERRRLLWKEFGVTNHAPVRRYYIARNRVLTYRRHWRTAPGWVLRDFLSLVRESIKIAGWEERPGTKLRHTARGLRDGVRGRTGPFPGPPPP